MTVPILKTPMRYAKVLEAELSFFIMEFTGKKLILNADINPLTLIEKGFPEEILDGIKDSLLRFLSLRLGVSGKNIEIQSFRNTYVVYPNPRDLSFDTSIIEESIKKGKICDYRVGDITNKEKM